MKVLGTVLLEFRHPETKKIVPEMVYIYEGTKTNLLSFGACVALGYMSPNMSTVGDPEACLATQKPASEAVTPKITSPTSNPEESNSCRDADLGTALPGGVRRGKADDCPCDCPLRTLPPEPPDELPCEPTVENVKRLESWILDYYRSSAFNVCECQPLPTMHGDPLQINVEEGAKPVASHTPIPVPIHWNAEVKKQLDRDERLGVIERVPSGTDTTWCHRMVIVPKKDNTPRRTINFQPLNAVAKRQTHHTLPPFEQVSRVPPGVFKTVMDAWNGYHSV